MKLVVSTVACLLANFANADFTWQSGISENDTDSDDPAQRRFYHQDQATDFIGFRCVMSRLGGKSLDMKKRSRN